MHSSRIGEIQWKEIHNIFMTWHQQPTGIRTWVDSTLRVASQLSNQIDQRVQPANTRLSRELGCHSIDSQITKMYSTCSIGQLWLIYKLYYRLNF